MHALRSFCFNNVPELENQNPNCIIFSSVIFIFFFYLPHPYWLCPVVHIIYFVSSFSCCCGAGFASQPPQELYFSVHTELIWDTLGRRGTRAMKTPAQFLMLSKSDVWIIFVCVFSLQLFRQINWVIFLIAGHFHVWIVRQSFQHKTLLFLLSSMTIRWRFFLS